MQLLATVCLFFFLFLNENALPEHLFLEYFMNDASSGRNKKHPGTGDFFSFCYYVWVWVLYKTCNQVLFYCFKNITIIINIPQSPESLYSGDVK